MAFPGLQFFSYKLDIVVSESTKSALISAVLTGIFTVLAGVAVYFFTTKEPELVYSVVGGPALSNALGAKRIFVVEVRNEGKKEVSQTLIHVALKGGELSEAASEASPGVKVLEEKTPNLINIKADLLNPGDSVKVSFLASLVTTGIEPTVAVRSPGVKATAENSKLDEKSILANPNKIMAFILPIAAALASYLVSARVGRIRRIVEGRSPNPSLDQSEITAYLCAACGLHEEANQLRFGGSEVSYRGTSDFIMQKALQADATLRIRYEAALRALLHFAPTSTNSRKSIRYAINSISSNQITDEEFEQIEGNVIKEGDDPIVWRRNVTSFVSQLGIGSDVQVPT
ncbi:hypothetical protein [Massilia niastensis]|uniref:hypothetical protein n=1 Tax=Massilia niastensis TaxID=544911 RepID=UPI0012EB5C6A|nr:hypothetical protein [Massilia niastensis]